MGNTTVSEIGDNFVAKMSVAMRSFLIAAILLICVSAVRAQERDAQESDRKPGFQKDQFFTGGSISLSFFNNTFLIGANPVLGYRLASFADAGLQVNIQHSSAKYYDNGERLRQTLYGGGVFTRLFPVNFLFAQGQWEHNWISQTVIDASSQKTKEVRSTNSLLVGGGYASGRNGQANSPFFYMMLLFDISRVRNTPYTDGYGRAIPVLRAGLTIPLFQGPKIGYR